MVWSNAFIFALVDENSSLSRVVLCVNRKNVLMLPNALMTNNIPNGASQLNRERAFLSRAMRNLSVATDFASTTPPTETKKPIAHGVHQKPLGNGKPLSIACQPNVIKQINIAIATTTVALAADLVTLPMSASAGISRPQNSPLLAQRSHNKLYRRLAAQRQVYVRLLSIANVVDRIW